MCSAAAIVLPVGALTTVIPAAVAASRSTLSTPTPARPTTWSRLPAAAITSRVDLDLAADDERVVAGQDRAQLVAGDPGTLVDLVVAPAAWRSLGGDRLGDEDPHARDGGGVAGRARDLDGERRRLGGRDGPARLDRATLLERDPLERPRSRRGSPRR